MGQSPRAGLMRVLEGQAEALAGTFIAQGVANTLWAYATMGWEPGARERVLFIGTQFSILYTSVYLPAGAAYPCAWCL